MDTVVVGGGQAGLSVSYYLTRQRQEHVVLEQADAPADAWRKHRWDSFTLNTPSWQSQLPGAEHRGVDPDAFMTRAEIVAYFEDYVRRFRLPVRYGTQVRRVERDPIRGKYYVTTSDGHEIVARNVVMATGLHQKPKIPAFSLNFPTHVKQLHSDDYRNPQQLLPGAVLVVGSAQSGAQIAEELYEAGRKVYLAVGHAGQTPRRYRGKDANSWLEKLGQYDKTVAELSSPKTKFAGKPHISGTRGGHTINLHKFARDGVILLGHLRGVHDGKIELAPDLHENLAAADQFEADFVKQVDAYIARTGMTVREETLPIFRDGFDQPVVTELDLGAAGITNVIWATSYSFDFSLVKLPIFDGDGYPIQTRGVTAHEGLFFVGLPWLHDGKSGLIYGVGCDAAYVARTIKDRERRTPFWRSRPHSGVLGRQAGVPAQKRLPQGRAAISRAFRMIATAVVIAASTIGLSLAQEITLENTGTRDVATTSVVQRVPMRVSLLPASADGAEVERVLGRPATTTFLDALGADRSLVYADETMRTEVTLTANRVTAVALDLLQINSRSLPMRARMVKAMMRRSGVLALLGKPEGDERRATYGLETERMMFRAADGSEFSVLLADGLVVDVTLGNEKNALGVRPFALPAAIPDASVGSDLRIGLSPKQVDALLGPPVYLPIASALEGVPVLYETRFTQSGCRVVSLTFIGEVLTAFAISPPNVARSLGVTCSPVGVPG
jgi:putative flavoprotein involved in K+ transport